MTKILIKLFIKNSDDIENPDVRNKYGSFSGIVGILLNILLFGKFIAGVITSSIAITATRSITFQMRVLQLFPCWI